MCTDYFVRGAGDVTTLVRQDACIGDDGYIKAKKIERKKKKKWSRDHLLGSDVLGSDVLTLDLNVVTWGLWHEL
jgi:hypothetical protein